MKYEPFATIFGVDLEYLQTFQGAQDSSFRFSNSVQQKTYNDDLDKLADHMIESSARDIIRYVDIRLPVVFALLDDSKQEDHRVKTHIRNAIAEQCYFINYTRYEQENRTSAVNLAENLTTTPDITDVSAFTDGQGAFNQQVARRAQRFCDGSGIREIITDWENSQNIHINPINNVADTPITVGGTTKTVVEWMQFFSASDQTLTLNAPQGWIDYIGTAETFVQNQAGIMDEGENL